VSLGDISAGTIEVTEGAWARSDGCRSVHATTDNTERYYAKYYSFTLSEAVDAHITLSALSRERFYLLEGAGTSGTKLATALAPRSATPASYVGTLEPGTYTIEATHILTEREYDFTLTVAVTLAAPTVDAALVAEDVIAGGPTLEVSLVDGFSGTVDSYTASSSDETILEVAVDGRVLSLSGIAEGTATVTVTATNTSGSATQAFDVTVIPLEAPTTGDTLPAQEVIVDGPVVEVDVAAGFSGIVDSYTATSSDETILEVAVDGTALSLSGIAEGTATVTVTATNTSGSATQTFDVTVITLDAPTVGDTIAIQVVYVDGAAVEVDIAAGFNGTVDAYTATSSDESVLSVSLAGSIVSLTGMDPGISMAVESVTVTATNAAGSASQSFTVLVIACENPNVQVGNGSWIVICW